MTLLDKLHAAEEGSRELDARAAFEAGFECVDRGGSWRELIERIGIENFTYFDQWNIPHYTTSIDAALTLVPEGCLWAVGHRGDETPGVFQATIMPMGKQISADAPTPALALCIAALEAREKA